MKTKNAELEYGLYKGARGYVCQLPLPDGSKWQCNVVSKEEALELQRLVGISEWGEERFTLLLEGQARTLLSANKSVSVTSDLRSVNTKFMVHYKVDGKKKSKTFNAGEFGESEAELLAHWCAAEKRAEACRSDLRLPMGLDPLRSFDIKSSVTINVEPGVKSQRNLKV